MSKKTFDKIAEGLNEALAVVRDETKRHPAMNQPGGHDALLRRLVTTEPPPTKPKQERIARLRKRLQASTDPDPYALRDVLKGVLDLLADEL